MGKVYLRTELSNSNSIVPINGIYIYIYIWVLTLKINIGNILAQHYCVKK